MNPAGAQRRRAATWAGLASISGALLTLARSAVLSRLLPPDEYGRFGLVLFALTAVTTFTELGVGRFLLVAQHANAEEERALLDTTWSVQVARGAALTALLALAAVPYATALHQPALGPLLAASACSLVIAATGNPGMVLLYRAYDQRTLGLLRVSGELLGLLVTAVIALWRPTAWALVVGWLATCVYGAVASFVVHPFRPRWHIDRTQFRRSFAQGRHLTVVTALTFVTTQVDNLIVGRVLGTAVLGLYLFAYRLATIPVEQLQAVTSAVAMPSYRAARPLGAAALAQQLEQVVAPATAVLCGMLLPFVLLRHEIVTLLGGTRWLDAVPLLPPLAALAFLRCTTIHLGALLQAVERADLDARAKVCEAIFFVPGCIVAVRTWGVLGACWTGVATYALALTLRTVSLRTVMPGHVVSATLAWARLAAVAVLLATAGSLIEQAGVPALVVAPAACLAFVALAWSVEPQVAQAARRIGMPV